MATRIVRLEGDPILRKKCKIVKQITSRTNTLIEDMFNTMYEARGIGLAAPQVGILKRICVIDCGLDKPDPHILINPEILYTEGEQTGDEGCLSLPGYKGTVKRAQKVKVKFNTLDMGETTLLAEGLLARCIQHETDHLDGILYIDKVEGELRKVDESENTEDKGRLENTEDLDSSKQTEENVSKEPSKG